MYIQRSNSNRIAFALLIVGSLALLTLYFRGGEAGLLHRAQEGILTLITPFQRGVTVALDPLRETWATLTRLGSLKEENLQLKEEVGRLRGEMALLRQARGENRKLRGLLLYRRQLPYRTVIGQVIGMAGAPWRRSLIVDRGGSEGIREHMPVLAEGGLVGQVVAVAPGAAQIQPITDHRSGVGGRIERTGEIGLVEGQMGGKLTFRLLPRNADLKVGDRVVTSGLGGVYPRGITIGRVGQIRRSSISVGPEVEVRPAVDFDRIEDVFIITNPDPPVPKRFREKR